MDLAKEMAELKKRGTNRPIPLAKLAKITAASLDQAASQAAFQLFRDKKFRQLAKFESLEKIEQDRIFNELVLATLTVLMLTMDARDLRVPEEMMEYYQLLKTELPKAHIDYLASMGIEKNYLRDWEKLIQMRYQEYDEDKLKAREAAMIVEAREKGELDVKDIEGIQLLLPVQTVAIGCHHHICRSKTEGRDELFKLTLKWLGRFYIQIRVPMEGGKITPLAKLKVSLRHLKNRLLSKT